jgi:hypothetical protein
MPMATSPQGKASRAEHAVLTRHALVEAVARIEGFVSVIQVRIQVCSL